MKTTLVIVAAATWLLIYLVPSGTHPRPAYEPVKNTKPVTQKTKDKSMLITGNGIFTLPE